MAGEPFTAWWPVGGAEPLSDSDGHPLTWGRVLHGHRVLMRHASCDTTHGALTAAGYESDEDDAPCPCLWHEAMLEELQSHRHACWAWPGATCNECWQQASVADTQLGDTPHPSNPPPTLPPSPHFSEAEAWERGSSALTVMVAAAARTALRHPSDDVEVDPAAAGNEAPHGPTTRARPPSPLPSPPGSPCDTEPIDAARAQSPISAAGTQPDEYAVQSAPTPERTASTSAARFQHGHQAWPDAPEAPRPASRRASMPRLALRLALCAAAAPATEAAMAAATARLAMTAPAAAPARLAQEEEFATYSDKFDIPRGAACEAWLEA